jgi:hypothetical protein
MTEKPFDDLRNNWGIEADGRILPTLGQYSLGAVGAILRTQKDVDWFFSDPRQLEVAGENVIPFQIEDPWSLMRRAAGEGLCGFQVFEAGEWGQTFTFNVRVEEAGSPLPTVLRAANPTGGASPSLLRLGERLLEPGEILPWSRFDILDRASARWGGTCPFRDWEHGDQLFEIANDHCVILVADVPLLGDWNSTDGSFAFFSSEIAAERFHRFCVADGQNRMIVTGGDLVEPEDIWKSLEVRPVSDLASRLDHLASINPFAKWCVNPRGYRENAGYGALGLGGPNDGGPTDPINDTGYVLETVSGTWRVWRENRFELEEPLVGWSGHDTIGWSGGSSLQLMPLRESFGANSFPDGIDLESLTDTEADEVVSQLLDVDDDEASFWEEAVSATDDQEDLLDQFHIVWWDAITGDGSDFPYRFPSPLDALSFLASFERQHDRVRRSKGAVSCSHIGFRGSGNEEAEDLTSERFRLGLRRIGVRILRDGYHPRDVEDLVALCNGTLKTLHVQFAGFAKDLLWASASPEQQEEILDQLGIESSDWWSQFGPVDAKLDRAGTALAMERITPEIWGALEDHTRQFVTTALLQLEEQESAPFLDFAPISLEIVKALEVELGALLGGFRDTLDGSVPEGDESQFEEREFLRFLRGGKPPTLGPISRLLRTPKRGGSDLHRSLNEYLNSLPNGEFLTSTRFAKKGLGRVAHKYRNGGVHDSPVSEGVCRECVEVVIGTRDDPGFLQKVANSKIRGGTSPEQQA